MDASDEERRKAQKTGELIDEKLLKIMELQGEIDCLLREIESSPFSSQKWQNASLEAKQRVMTMAAIQFLIFEPVDRVDGNDKLKIAADKLLEVLGNQLKGMATTEPGG